MEKAILRSEDGSPTVRSAFNMPRYKKLRGVLRYVCDTKELDRGAKESVIKNVQRAIGSLPDCGGIASKVLCTIAEFKKYTYILNYIVSTDAIEPSAKEGVIEEIKSRVESLPVAATFKASRGGRIDVNVNGLCREYNEVAHFFKRGFYADNLSDLGHEDVLYVIFDKEDLN